MRRHSALVILTLVALILSPPPTIHADEAAIHPGESIGPIKLGSKIEEIAQALGRPFASREIRGCGASYRWTSKEGDPILSAGEDIVIWTPIISGQASERAGAITIIGEKSTLTTAGGVGLGSAAQDVIAEHGPPSVERPEGDGKFLVYGNIGLQFLIEGHAVRGVTVFWPLLKTLEVRPFSGIGPVSLGMDESRVAEVMGRPSDIITPLRREAWTVPIAPSYSQAACNPYLAVRTYAGKVDDIFTTAPGFRTPGGTQVGDSIDGLVKELGSGRASSGAVGTVMWTKIESPRAIFIVGYRTFEDGVKRILYFWIQAF